MPPLPDIPEWVQSERLKHERELTGFYISSHPLACYEATIQAYATASTISLPELSDGREVKLCGIITTVKNMLTKKGDRMAYLTLEDLQGVVEIIVFPDLYKNAADLKYFVTERGKIVPRRISGNCARHQREVATAIKRGRQVALLPFTVMAHQ